MIQILMTTLNKKNTIKRQFIVQLSISIIGILIIISCYFYYRIQLINYEKLSKTLSQNYKISKLYSEYNNNNSLLNDSDILGTITIPKLNISYTFFNGLTDELLKIAPCRYYGDMPDKKGNLCIAGHNYNDNRFFSKINTLENNDKIIIYDNLENKFIYSVFDKYEVKDNDFSPIYEYDKNINQITLITCNNFNNNRIIVKGIIK